MKFHELKKTMFLGRLVALGCICLLTVSVISLARWWKDQPRLPPPYNSKTAYKLCWQEASSYMRDPSRKGALDGRYDNVNKRMLTKETYPGQFGEIVDIRCEWDPDQQQGSKGKIYGIAYLFTRRTDNSPPKLERIAITKGYKFDSDL
jgi:hypothetical protein